MARLVKSIYSGMSVTSLGETTDTDTLDGPLAATIAVDMSTSCNFTVTLGGNRTLGNPTGMVTGQTGSIFIVQDGAGGRTLAYSSNWDFPNGTAPTLSTAAGTVDRLDYIVRSSTAIQAVLTTNYS